VNLDFGLDPVFSWYVVLLCLSGIVMVVLGAINKGEQSAGSRALGVLAGVAFLGYGIYLGFIFDGGSYMMFFQAFILPALLVVNFVRSVVAKPTPPQPYQGAHAQQYQGVPPQQQYPTAPAQAQPSPYDQSQPYPGTPAQAQPYPGTPAQAQPYAADPTQPYPGQPQPGPGSSQLN
jgi:predicted lipid-binding transport protein (Tim44 family)